MDIFKSVPAKGAVTIDATGPDDEIIVDIENGLGEKFHFEIVNGEEIFKPSYEIKMPSGAGRDKPNDLKKHIVIFRMPR